MSEINEFSGSQMTDLVAYNQSMTGLLFEDATALDGRLRDDRLEIGLDEGTAREQHITALRVEDALQITITAGDSPLRQYIVDKNNKRLAAMVGEEWATVDLGDEGVSPIVTDIRRALFALVRSVPSD